ncbi:MAG: transposase [Saprospiraceae bacterium]|nr:transposase [Saprospiraceae bacterium]WKZ64425.1 MAG: transposase [Saprospiraceae bacterium]
MSKRKRRNFCASFKAKVALEAIKERSTLSELSVKYEVHPNQISEWKKQLLTGVEQVFLSGKQVDKEPDWEKQLDELYKVVGQLKVENDWLKKKSEQVFGKN